MTIAAALGLIVSAFVVAPAQDRFEPNRTSPEWAARNAGSLDSRSRALLDQGSAEPVVLGIRARQRFLADGRSEPVDEHIAFRLPAAAFTLFDLDRGGQTNQRIGWEVFSRTLDPVRLDRQADQADRPPADSQCRVFGLPNSRFAARRANGEYILRIEVTGVLRTAEERQRVLWGRSGMGEQVFLRRGRGCAFQHDGLLDMLRTEEPPDSAAAMACELSGFVGVSTQDGRTFRPAKFLKLEPDGAARFVVICRAYVIGAPDVVGPFCELQGYLGQWPLFMWVPSNRAAEWNETFLRVRDHLSRHVASRSD